jgi:Flp pilus assembly CpaF family ATPase
MTTRHRHVGSGLDGTLSLIHSYSQSDWSYRMQQTIGDAIEPGAKQKLIAMMVKKAVDIFTEAVKEFAKAVMSSIVPAIWAVVRFFESASHILKQDKFMIHSWENEGGAVCST